MKEESRRLRKTLSANIKKQREMQGLTQEKLAEITGMSANMMNDIEGCRTWVSDKTLIKLATALHTDIYRLFMPMTLYEDEIHKTIVNDLAQVLLKIRKDVNTNFDNALKGLS